MTYQNLFHQTLASHEREATVEYARTEEALRWLSFYPQDLQHKRQVWTPDINLWDAAYCQFENQAEVIEGDVNDLGKAINKESPGMIVCRIDSLSMPDVPNGLKTEGYFYNGGYTIDFLPGVSSKGVAARKLMELCGLRAGEVLIAGDAPSDLDMLKIPGVHALIVENPKVDYDLYPAEIVRVKPHQLGLYLGSLPFRPR